MKIKNIIPNILVSIFIITLFLFAFTWIIFDFQGSSNSLKDTWSIVSSLFGGIATLAAAYIASLLFNDWRDQHRVSFYEKFYYDFRDKAFLLNNSYQPIKDILLKTLNTTLDNEQIEEYERLKRNFISDIDYLIKILDDLLYIIRKDDLKYFDKISAYRSGILKVKAFFEINDLFGDDIYISVHLVENNIKNGRIEAGIQGLNLLFSLDFLDVILEK